MSLPWILLLTPLASAAIITLFTLRFRGLSSFISVAAILVSFGCSWAVFLAPDPASARWTWIDIPGVFNISLGLTIDHWSRPMLLIVTFIGALIHIYSLGYMRDEPGKSRYFAALSLFIFAMLGIVLANNFVMLFIFWELVGFTSYLLIGHWFDRDSAAEAAKKAFLTNRVGDFGFMLGILMLWAATGSIVFAELEPRIATLALNPAYLSIVALLLFCGAVAKSAQFPLHVWLPDAMEGPTPVSALIHAATMVAAGVYMLVRIGFIINASQDALMVIAWIGTITAFMAALIATQQDDIKRVLAYSTLSQLGYMIAAVGMASPEAGMFHLFTHAFFKALLFLGAGAIIIALHHEQNIWKMGGLSRNMPITFLAFAAGAFALIGFPFFSGFFSKDAILALAYERDKAIFALGLTTAFLTAFYVTRLFVAVFWGKPRSDQARKSDEAPFVMTGPLIILAVLSAIAGYRFFAGTFIPLPKEDHPVFLVPALASGVMVAGVILGIALYRNQTAERFNVRFLERGFYIDNFYHWLIERTQGLLARSANFIDRWIIDVAGVRGVSGGTWGFGALLRLFQVGNLQAYAFLFGLAIVAVIYFTLFF
jgi:NADH-quinone oxidoreductase subunit L